MAFINVYDVRKAYGGINGQTALAGVDLDIDEGEFVAIMGPSGSGKSTLLAAIGGLAHPSSGRIVIDDIEIYRLSTDTLADFRHEYLGFVFQEHQLIPYLTALENVMLPLAISERPRREHEEIAMIALDRVLLGGKYDRLPSQLSSGEQERVAIARALVNQPPIMLADEPTGSLDTQTRREILSLFKNLNDKDGLTIVMVTHSHEDAEAASRIVNINDGRICAAAIELLPRRRLTVDG